MPGSRNGVPSPTMNQTPDSNLEKGASRTLYSLLSGLTGCLQTCRSRVEAFFRRVKAGRIPGIPVGLHLNDAGTHLSASKIGDIPIVLHRPIEGPIKTLTIRRTATGKWYACSSVEYEPTPAREKGTVVGVDVGLESFATLSNERRPRTHDFSAPTRKRLRRRRGNFQKRRKALLNGRKPERLSHASMNGSRTVGSILLTRPPGSWWIGSHDRV